MQENCKRYIVLNQPDHKFEIACIFGNQNPASKYFLAMKTKTHWGRPCQNSPPKSCGDNEGLFFYKRGIPWALCAGWRWWRGRGKKGDKKFVWGGGGGGWGGGGDMERKCEI